MSQWAVPPEWRGETVVILASGPSMTREVAEYVRGKARVIAVSNQGIDNEVAGQVVPAIAPWADVLYSADAKWWTFHRERALAFAGRRVSVRSALRWPEVLTLDLSPEPVFDPRPTHIASGGNSGYQALHLGVQFGATRAVLCGFNMKDVHGRNHWFGRHPPRLHSRGRYSAWLQSFGRLAVVLKERGVEVINATPDSALKCFPCAKLEAVL